MNFIHPLSPKINRVLVIELSTEIPPFKGGSKGETQKGWGSEGLSIFFVILSPFYLCFAAIQLKQSHNQILGHQNVRYKRVPLYIWETIAPRSVLFVSFDRIH